MRLSRPTVAAVFFALLALQSRPALAASCESLASLSLRNDLVNLMGGIQNAGTMLSAYLTAFYSDAERTAIENAIWPDLFIAGGGISRKADKWIPLLTNRTPVVAATLLNTAGIVGAAMASEVDVTATAK